MADRAVRRLKKPIARERVVLGGMHRDALRLFGAASMGYGVAFLASPLLTRLYSPEEFGIYVLFGAVAFCDVVACLGFDRAIVVTRDDGVAKELFFIACLSSVAVVVLCLVGMAAASGYDVVPTWFVWGVPLYVGAYGLMLALGGVATRSGQVGAIANARLVQSLTNPSLQLALGFGPKGAMSLAVGQIGGAAAGAIAYLRRLRRTSQVHVSPLPDRSRVLATVRQFDSFPRCWVPATLLNSVNQQLPLFTISVFFGAHAGGLFGFGQRIIGAGVGLVCAAVSQAYFVHAAAALRSDESIIRLRKQVFAVLKAQMLLTLPFVVVLLLSPMWMATVFGDQWNEAGFYFQLLAIPFASQLCISPIHALIDALQEPRLHLWRELTRLALTGLALTIPLVLATKISTVLMAYAASVCASYMLGLYVIVRALDHRIRGLALAGSARS
jgi:O-antigen/teichoic acid export membrane protein